MIRVTIRNIVVVTIVLFCVVGVLILFRVLPYPTSTTQTCVVGFTGYTWNVTISGDNAVAQCDDIVHGKVNLFGGPYLRGTTFLFTQKPDGSIVCEANYMGEHLLVRDFSADGLRYSQEFCSSIEQDANPYQK